MPIYTVRYRVLPLNTAPRGVPWVEMTHHFVIGSDEDAEASLPGLVEAFTDAGISDRWVAVRGGPAHYCTLYRRTLEDWSRWVRIGEEVMELPAWPELDFSLPAGEFSIPLTGSAAPIFPAGREACTVTELAANGTRRRVFVGPISPVAAAAVPDVPLLELPFVSWGPGPSGDYPYDPANDVPNLHRGDLAALARDHVHDLGSYTVGGYKVVVSPKSGTVSAVQRTWASRVKASLSTRSSRGPRTADAVNPIVPG